jgi:hypothetical protein
VSWYYTAAEASADLRILIAMAREGCGIGNFGVLRRYLETWRDAVKKSQYVPTFTFGSR